MKVGCNDLAIFLKNVWFGHHFFRYGGFNVLAVFSHFLFGSQNLSKRVNDFKWLFRNVAEKNLFTMFVKQAVIQL